MAIAPVTLTRTWYSLGNVPYTPTSADDCQKWFLWLWKELLIGNYAGKGGTVGPEGPRPAGSFWTVESSSDGAGTVDTQDLWVSRTNVILGNPGTNHSWVVLKSPVATNPNGALGFGQGPMYMLLDNSSASGTAAAARAIIMFSREPFTGGTATERPTSPKEFIGSKYVATNLAPTIWTNGTYNTVRRMSISVDANGQFYMVTAVAGTGAIESSHCLVENINADDRDLYRQHSFLCYFGNCPALNSRNWAGTAQRTANMTNSDSSNSSGGGLIRWRFGIGFDTNALAYTTGINGSSTPFAEGLPINGIGPGTYGGAFGAGQGLDVDGYVIALPLYVLDYGAGWYTRDTQNVSGGKPEWRGQLPDAWAISRNNDVGIPIGASYPNAAAQTHVVLKEWVSWEARYIIPMSVQLAL